MANTKLVKCLEYSYGQIYADMIRLEELLHAG